MSDPKSTGLDVSLVLGPLDVEAICQDPEGFGLKLAEVFKNIQGGNQTSDLEIIAAGRDISVVISPFDCGLD